MQLIIHAVVHAFRVGFIPDMFIADNILLATKLIRGYTRVHISPRCVYCDKGG